MSQRDLRSRSAELDATMNEDIATLVADLEAADAQVRAGAAEQLCRRGEAARSAAVELVRTAGDVSDAVRQWASSALEELGPPQVDQVDALAQLTGHSNPAASYWAATLLGRLGPDAAGAVPALCEALCRHPDPATRERAAWALGKIGVASELGLAALRAAAQTASPRLARLATQALEKLEKGK